MEDDNLLFVFCHKLRLSRRNLYRMCVCVCQCVRARVHECVRVNACVSVRMCIRYFVKSYIATYACCADKH